MQASSETKQVGKWEIRLDAADGRLIGEARVAPTGDACGYETIICEVRDASGVHDLYLVGSERREGSAVNIHHFAFH